MATVFDNSMTAHVWAQFTQDSGRSHNGNLYFEGRALYSYGRHYVAAYLAPAPGNPGAAGVALINADSYSVSTSRHVSNAASATRHRGRVLIPNLNPVAKILADALRNASPRLNPGCYPTEYGEPNAREVARYAVPRLAAHFAKPGNLPADPRNASAEGRADMAESVAEVFRAAQCDNPERRARSAIKAAERAAIKAEEKAAKAKTRRELAELAEAARRDPAEVVAEMKADAKRAARYHNAEREAEAWAETGRRIFRAIKAGKAAGHTARVRKASAVRKAIRATLPAFELAAERHNRRAAWAANVADVRKAITAAETGATGSTRPGEACLAYVIREGASDARRLAERLAPDSWAYAPARIMGHNPGELAERLTALAAELDSRAERAAEIERANRIAAELAAVTAARELAPDAGPAEVERIARAGQNAAERYATRPVIGTYAPGPLNALPDAFAAEGWTPDALRELAADMGERITAARAELARIAAEETERAKAEALAIWRAGDAMPRELARHAPRALPDGSAYIRARDVERDAAGNVTGGTLETSQSASVPLAHAIRVFRFLKACREAGQGWRANGRTLRVGHFAVDEVDSAGNFRAGCHRIAWAEVAALAERLGLADMAPADTTETRAHT